MKETILSLLKSLTALAARGDRFSVEVTNPNEGLIYIMTGESKGITVKVIGRGRINKT